MAGMKEQNEMKWGSSNLTWRTWSTPLSLYFSLSVTTSSPSKLVPIPSPGTVPILTLPHPPLLYMTPIDYSYIKTS